jgi:transposase-like protein
MSVLSRPEFHDEAKAFEHIEGTLWPYGAVCHHCGSMAAHYKLVGVRSKPSKKNPHGVERHGLWKCKDCRKQFTVRMGTIFEESHLPLHKWLQAIHLMCASKKGISAHQMHRILECKYDTAWFLCHRIRFAMASGDFSPLGGNGKVVEGLLDHDGEGWIVPETKGSGVPAPEPFDNSGPVGRERGYPPSAPEGSIPSGSTDIRTLKAGLANVLATMPSRKQDWDDEIPF